MIWTRRYILISILIAAAYPSHIFYTVALVVAETRCSRVWASRERNIAAGLQKVAVQNVRYIYRHIELNTKYIYMRRR